MNSRNPFDEKTYSFVSVLASRLINSCLLITSGPNPKASRCRRSIAMVLPKSHSSMYYVINFGSNLRASLSNLSDDNLVTITSYKSDQNLWNYYLSI